MKIIQHARIEHVVAYSREFRWRDSPSAGFSFDSDATGAVDPGALKPAGRENFEKCLDGTYDVEDAGVSVASWSYRLDAVGLCACGCKVDLGGWTNTCERCGRDYNSAGQELAPREQWGEETGESVADILRADCGDWGEL